MFDINSVRAELTQAILQLEFETSTLWRELQATDWYGNRAHFPFAHYGYMMAIFSRIDLLSRYWAGSNNNQTQRMVGFLEEYVHPGKSEENCIAVQLWRHTLMHTGEARQLLDVTTRKRYTWYVSFGHMDGQQHSHYSIYFHPHDRIHVLVIELTELVKDLKRGQERYLQDLDTDAGGTQGKYLSQDGPIRLQQFRSSRSH